jgi:MFS family permease
MSDKISSWNVVHKLEKRQLLIAINCAAALSILMFGYDQGLMGGVNTSKDYIDLMGFGYTEYVNGTMTPVVTNSLLQGGIVAVYYLGTLFGALFGGWVGDRIGRIRTIALGTIWGIIGASLQTSAQNHNWMICGKYGHSSDCIFLYRPSAESNICVAARTVNGFGTGILNTIIPVWATETSVCGRPPLYYLIFNVEPRSTPLEDSSLPLSLL